MAGLHGCDGTSTAAPRRGTRVPCGITGRWRMKRWSGNCEVSRLRRVTTSTTLETRRVVRGIWRRQTKYRMPRTCSGATLLPVAAPAGGRRDHRDWICSFGWWRSIAHSQPGGFQWGRGAYQMDWSISSRSARSAGARGQRAPPSCQWALAGRRRDVGLARIGSGRISGRFSTAFVGNHRCPAGDPGPTLRNQGRC